MLELLFKLLNETQKDNILESVFHAIGHNNEHLTAEQIAILTTFKDQENTNVKHGLISALSGLDELKAIRTLIEFTNDKISSIRNWATFGISTRIEVNNIEIINALWNRVDDIDQETRYEAITGLVNRNDSRVKDVIFRELEHQEYGTLLFEAIQTLKDKDFLPLLEMNLKNAENDTNINNGWRFALEGTIKELKK